MAGRNITTRKLGKVLVINSDPEIINILEINLAHANLEIVSARSGSEALRKIQKDKTDIIILDPALPDIEGMEIYRKITGSHPINNIPIILLSTRLPRKNMITQAEDIPIYHITKPFNPKEVVAMVQGYLMHKERMVHINPLTGLPNRLQISKEIDKLLRQKKTFSAIYIVFHDLKGVNKAYGYALGDRMVQLLADIVSETVRLSGNVEDLVGYYGGDKFVVISTPGKARALCRKIIADFDKRIPVLYTEENVPMSRTAPRKPSANREQALSYADNLREIVASTGIKIPGLDHPLRITISGGVATFPADGETTTELINAADQALYGAKRNGRNEILLANPVGLDGSPIL